MKAIHLQETTSILKLEPDYMDSIHLKDRLRVKLKPDYILGIDSYYTVKKFAKLVGRTEQTIRYLITHGNIIRKLAANHEFGHIMIPVSEYTEFPFTEPGRGAVYHTYNLDGTLTQGNVNEI